MQRIDTSRRRSPAGDGPIRGHGQRAALHSIGTPSAPRITTLAPAFGQALPTLSGVPAEYNHEVNAELLYDLGAALVNEGLASPEKARYMDRQDGSGILQLRSLVLAIDRCDCARLDRLRLIGSLLRHVEVAFP